MKTLNNEREKVVKKNYNEEKTQLRLKEALAETRTAIRDKYKQKHSKKFEKKEK